MEFYLIDILYVYIAFTSIVWGIGFSTWLLVRMIEKSNQAEEVDDAFYHNTRRPMRIRTITLFDELKGISDSQNK